MENITESILFDIDSIILSKAKNTLKSAKAQHERILNFQKTHESLINKELSVKVSDNALLNNMFKVSEQINNQTLKALFDNKIDNAQKRIYKDSIKD